MPELSADVIKMSDWLRIQLDLDIGSLHATGTVSVRASGHTYTRVALRLSFFMHRKIPLYWATYFTFSENCVDVDGMTMFRRSLNFINRRAAIRRVVYLTLQASPNVTAV
jgi:hypothetical protein